MAKKTFDASERHEYGQRAHEDWMKNTSSGYTEEEIRSISDEDTNVLMNLMTGKVGPLIDLLKTPKKHVPLQIRLILIQMLSESENCDFHFTVNRNAQRLGSRGRDIGEKIADQLEYEKLVGEVGDFIIENQGYIRANLLKALYLAELQFGYKERKLREIWADYQKYM